MYSKQLLVRKKAKVTFIQSEKNPRATKQLPFEFSWIRWLRVGLVAIFIGTNKNYGISGFS